MAIGWEPRARDFPRRNRLISGLSLGVVIVEAAQRLSSLITARLAAEQGREVFAVPGSPLDPRAEGTNGLIKQGATPVTETADIISVLQPIMREDFGAGFAGGAGLAGGAGEPPGEALARQRAGRRRARADPRAAQSPVSIDDLVRLSRSSPRVARMVLLELEIAGRLERHLERHGGGLVSLS